MIDPICVKLSFNGQNVVDILISCSENVSHDTDTIEEKVDLPETKNIHETIENQEEDEKYNNLNEDTIDKTKEDDTNCVVEQDVSNTSIKSGETSRTYEEQSDNVNEAPETCEGQEEHVQEIHQDVENSVMELTVDEIVQNMEKDATDEPPEKEETHTSTPSDADVYENNDVESVTKNLEELQTQDDVQSNEHENQTQEVEEEKSHQDRSRRIIK